jgi:hypothetical protein
MLLKQSARLEAILEELDKARLKFLHLLDEVSEKDWNRRFPGEGWTIKQENDGNKRNARIACQ